MHPDATQPYGDLTPDLTLIGAAAFGQGLEDAFRHGDGFQQLAEGLAEHAVEQ